MRRCLENANIPECKWKTTLIHNPPNNKKQQKKRKKKKEKRILSTIDEYCVYL